MKAVKNDKKTLEQQLTEVKIGDSVQYRSMAGGEAQLLRIDEIKINKRDETLPRLFVGRKFNGGIKYCTENQVVRVITRSVDDPADWIPAEEDVKKKKK